MRRVPNWRDDWLEPRFDGGFPSIRATICSLPAALPCAHRPTGDAAGGPTVVHFEIHPQGGPAVDPKPFVDQWVADAVAAAPGLIATIRAARVGPTDVVAPQMRLRNTESADFAGPYAPSPSEPLWAAAASPQRGPLQIAMVARTQAAATINWDNRTSRP